MREKKTRKKERERERKEQRERERETEGRKEIKRIPRNDNGMKDN